MRYINTLLLLIFSTYLFPLSAQSVLFSEDFETPPVISVTNDGSDTLRTGSSWCTEAARGNTTHHNSTRVDFQNTQNSSYFIALNPEDSCGGFNSAMIESDTFDFSGADSLYFSCRYFISDTIGWGAVAIEVTFNNGAATFTIDSQFTDTARWANVLVQLPDTFIDSTVWLTGTIGGGEAVGLDDLTVTNYPADTSGGGGVGISQKDELHAFTIYPNPVQHRLHITTAASMRATTVQLYRMSGRLVKEKVHSGMHSTLDVHTLPKGVYLVKMLPEGQRPTYRKVVKF